MKITRLLWMRSSATDKAQCTLYVSCAACWSCCDVDLGLLCSFSNLEFYFITTETDDIFEIKIVYQGQLIRFDKVSIALMRNEGPNVAARRVR